MSVATTLAAIKTLLATISSPAAPAVYAYPDDYGAASSLDYGTLPVISVSHAIDRENEYAMRGLGACVRHTYYVEIRGAFSGVSSSADSQAAAELAARNWSEAIAAKIGANVNLSNGARLDTDPLIDPLFIGYTTPPDRRNKLYYGLLAYVRVTEDL